MGNKYDIFISYRREDGAQYARILSQMLKKRGYKVFHDYENLKTGNFADLICKAIQETPVFLMVLSPHYLDRCNNEDDWIRQEIMLAYQYKKYIIPVNPDNLFDNIPSDIPVEIKQVVTMHQHAQVSFGQLMESSIDKLVGCIPNKVSTSLSRKSSYDVFLAYPRIDIQAADKLSQIIQTNGISVWRDVDGIYAGEQFVDVITNAISNSKVIVALYSKWALESTWFKKELALAQEKNIPIIKVLTDNTEGLSGTRRMSFGSLLEMGSNRFEEKLLSSILSNGCKSDTMQMLALGKELYDRSQKNTNLADEGTAFSILMRAAELGDHEALSYVESQAWNIDLKNAALQYIPINSYFVEDLRADLYNRGEIIAEDPTLTDVEQRGRGMEKAAFRMMKRAIDLGFEGSDPILYPWYYLTKDDFEWTVRELNFAQKKRKRIVFINIDGSELTDWFEMIFGTKQQIDASSDLLMNNLYSDLKKWLNVDDALSSPDKAQNNHSSQENEEDSFEDSIELQLAWMEYNDGNFKEALRSFLLEAKKGSANALNAIGLYYYEGKACSKNFQQAMFYFQKAAEMGYASAMRNLGDCYRWGHGVKRDMDKSIFWYKKAAEKKNLKAIYLLALCYRDIDPLQADQYFLEAAHMGHEEAIKYVISHGLAKHEDDIKWTNFIQQDTKESVENFQCHVVFKHKDAVESAVFSPDGKQIVSASDDYSLCIWNAESGEQLHRLKGHSDSVNCVAYNSDGSRIVSASDDDTVKIWDGTSGACLQTLSGHMDSVWSVSFSPNDKYIVSASVDKTIRVWDVQTARCIKTMRGHSMDVNYACFSPNGQLIASASEDGTTRIWAFPGGNCMQVLTGHSDGVWSARFSKEGDFIVSASADRTIRIWEVETGKCLKVLDGHSDDVNCASFSMDGRKILSASDDNTIRVWDLETGDCLQIIDGHRDYVNSAFYSPDGRLIVSASDDYTVKVWSI